MTHKIDNAPLPRPLEPMSTRPASRAGTEREAPVAASPAADSLRLTGEAAGLQALERELGQAPASFDAARVDAVRASIADGSYRIDPQAIADRMLSLEHDLHK
jgi:negative regulator of flagellin synthesis FlgM